MYALVYVINALIGQRTGHIYLVVLHFITDNHNKYNNFNYTSA